MLHRFQHVQCLIHTGRMKVKVNTKEVTNYESPKCAACEFGKDNIQPDKTNKTNKNPMKDKDLNKDHLLPINMLSADHYISRDPGRLYHTKVNLSPSDMS